MINYSAWRTAAQRIGICTQEFWQLTPAELLRLLNPHNTMPPLSRQQFNDLLQREIL